MKLTLFVVIGVRDLCYKWLVTQLTKFNKAIVNPTKGWTLEVC